MQLKPSPRKELISRIIPLFGLAIVGFVFVTGIIIPSVATAILPFYAQDFGVQFVDWSDETIELLNSAHLIEEYAVVFSEGTNRPGDAAHFQIASNGKMVHYLGFTNLWFGGVAGYLDSDIISEKVKFQEDNFYHSTDPATFSGWRESGSTIQFRWTKDLRFILREHYEDLILETISNEVEDYILVRKNLDTGEIVERSVGWITSCEDNPDSGYSYSYSLKSVTPLGISQGGEVFTFSTVPVLIDDTIPPGPKFWVEKDDYQENHYVGLIGNIQADNPVSWPFKFHCSEPVNPDDCIVEVWQLYNAETFDPQNLKTFDKVDYSGVSYDSISGELTLEISSSTRHMTDYGGIVYRLRYEPEGEVVEFFPKEDGTKKHFIWSSINNRGVKQLCFCKFPAATIPSPC